MKIGQRAYRNYLLSVLLVILAFNYVDRTALGLVLQDIKVDLSLSDTQLGLLTGIAFALFYAIMGIPIARWADRGDRVKIITITTIVWSALVVLCGTAGSFFQLMLIRVGIGVGEAGCIPPAHSLIADYFNRAERPRAVAIYMLGASLSTVIGYFVAGWLNEFYGWRLMFVVLGVPGLALGLLTWFTLKEPRRGTFKTSTTPHPPSLRDVGFALWASPTFRHLLLCFSVEAFFGYGILQWQPAFLIRSYGLQTGELGTWLAVIYGVGSFVGTYWGGELASRLAARNERLQLLAMAVAYCLFGLTSASIYLSSSRYLVFSLMAVGAVGIAIANEPLFAMIQSLVPERMRAVSIAIIYLFANLIGMGLGPLATGALSDLFRPIFGQESLRYALLVLSPGYWWAGWHLWMASKTVARDLVTSQVLEA